LWNQNRREDENADRHSHQPKVTEVEEPAGMKHCRPDYAGSDQQRSQTELHSAAHGRIIAGPVDAKRDYEAAGAYSGGSRSEGVSRVPDLTDAA